ncbi:MAG: PaaI family thioesterase [Deltaproteobacteria bacterium]|nr:PaaI family thioesterase [Deltaproteobacteria bacterium]
MTLVARVAAAKATGNLGPLIDVIPYAKFLGLNGTVVDDELITTMAFLPTNIGNPALPALHGGTLGALLESAAIFQLLWAAETVVLPKTITITVDYLRSAAPVDTYARGVIVRHGRRVANVSVEAWQDDRARPVATAHAHFLVMADS